MSHQYRHKLTWSSEAHARDEFLRRHLGRRDHEFYSGHKQQVRDQGRAAENMRRNLEEHQEVRYLLWYIMECSGKCLTTYLYSDVEHMGSSNEALISSRHRSPSSTFRSISISDVLGFICSRCFVWIELFIWFIWFFAIRYCNCYSYCSCCCGLYCHWQSHVKLSFRVWIYIIRDTLKIRNVVLFSYFLYLLFFSTLGEVVLQTKANKTKLIHGSISIVERAKNIEYEVEYWNQHY